MHYIDYQTFSNAKLVAWWRGVKNLLINTSNKTQSRSLRQYYQGELMAIEEELVARGMASQVGLDGGDHPTEEFPTVKA